MKLAEALIERKALKTKVEQLKKRIYQSASFQEGDTPVEFPFELIEELKIEVAKLERLIVKINQTNIVTKLPNGMTMMEAIVKKDMINYTYLIHNNLADKATPTRERYRAREIKLVPNVDIKAVRKKSALIAKEYRLLDVAIQETNWKTELIE